MTDDLERRIGDLELAVLALAVEEFGDLPGHPFRGNQHTGGSGSAREAKSAYVRSVAESEHDARQQDVGTSTSPHAAKAMDLLREIDARKGSATDATHLDRAQKLLNYEKMHGTAAMLEKMTPAEREAHAAKPFEDRPYVAPPANDPNYYRTSLFPGQRLSRDRLVENPPATAHESVHTVMLSEDGVTDGGSS